MSDTPTSSDLSTRASPFVRSAWYVAARAEEVTRTLAGTVVLGDPVVLYRTRAGAPVALIDACSHRKFPLSKSCLVGDLIRCGYHGFEFDAAGRCVAVPAANEVPAGADVRAYPVAERHGLVWIWMGARDAADPDLIVDCGHLATRSQVKRSDRIACHYQALIENLLDFSHLPFVHASNQGHAGNAAVIPNAKVENGVLVAHRLIKGAVAPPIFQQSLGIAAGTLVDHEQVFEFRAPSVVFIKQRMRPCEGGPDISFSSNHFVTPRDDCHTNYYSTLVIDRDDPSPEILAGMTVAAAVATEQDRSVLELQDENYRRLAGTPVDAPAIANRFDRAPLLARDMLRKRAAAERGT